MVVASRKHRTQDYYEILRSIVPELSSSDSSDQQLHCKAVNCFY